MVWFVAPCEMMSNLDFIYPTGKVFYMELDGAGEHPVMHFGMTGMLHVQALLSCTYYHKPDPSFCSISRLEISRQPTTEKLLMILMLNGRHGG